MLSASSLYARVDENWCRRIAIWLSYAIEEAREGCVKACVDDVFFALDCCAFVLDVSTRVRAMQLCFAVLDACFVASPVVP